MAKFTKNIERMIADLRGDEKIQAMHRDNIDRAAARRARRAELCRLFLAAYRYHKNDRRDVIVCDHNDDQAARRARMVEMCNRFDNADDFMARVREKVNILDPFYDLAYEVYSERKDKEIDDLLKGAQNALEYAKKRREDAEMAKKAAIRRGMEDKFAGEDKADIIDRLEGRTSDQQENKRQTLSLNRTVSKRENKILTVGNKKAYQVGKGDWKHRNGVIIDN